MKQVPLSAESRGKIDVQIREFKKHLTTEVLREDNEERKRRVLFFQNELPRRAATLSEADLVDVVSMLWASRMWGNKQFHAQKIVSSNSVETLRKQFVNLLDISKPVAVRYDSFNETVRGLGPASLTEMLCYIQPDRCGIWNKKAKEALKALGITDQIDTDKYVISGQEYEVFNQVLMAIAEKLKSAGIADVDLLLVDFFLFEVSERAQREPAPMEPKSATFEHDEIRDLLAEAGEMLGFDTDTEVAVAAGAKVDVVWRAKIGNLGIVTYVFEVQKAGSVDSLILNLQKARTNPSVQKVVAVSDSSQLERIKREVSGLPTDEFRRALTFLGVDEARTIHENLQRANKILDVLELTKPTF